MEPQRYSLAAERISRKDIGTGFQNQVYTGPSDPGFYSDRLPKTFGTKSHEGAWVPSFSFNQSPSKAFSSRTWQDVVGYSINYYPANDNNKVRVITSNNRGIRTEIDVNDLSRFGYAPYWEDKAINGRDLYRGNFLEWKKSTEKSHAITTGSGFREIGLWKSFEFVPNYNKHDVSMTNIGVPITRLYGEVPVTKVGFYVSKLGNLEHDLRDILYRDKRGFNPETEAYISFLQSKGLGPAREINGLAVKNFDAVAATQYNNGHAVLIASKDMYDKALSIAQRYGLTGEEAVKFAKMAVWEHELYHVFNREKLSERRDEIRVGKLLEEFFDSRASKLEGKIAQYYGAMAKENKDYAEGWRSGRIKGASLKSRLENLSREYYSEARAKGMTEEEAKNYTAGKLEQEIEEEMSNSEQRSEKGSRKSSNRQSKEAKESEYANDNEANENYESGNSERDQETQSDQKAANDNQPEAANDNAQAESQAA